MISLSKDLASTCSTGDFLVYMPAHAVGAAASSMVSAEVMLCWCMVATVAIAR